MSKINWEKIEKQLNRMNGYSLSYWKKGKGSYKLVPRIFIGGKELNHKKWTHIALVWDNSGTTLEDFAVFEKTHLTASQIKKIANNKA